MTIRSPNLNLVCNIWRSYSGTFPITIAPTLANVPCQLRTTLTAQQTFASLANVCWSIIILPPLTDVRDQHASTSPDIIECPAGSKRFYNVYSVEDRAKGFINEVRCVVAKQLATTPGGWPYPTP